MKFLKSTLRVVNPVHLMCAAAMAAFAMVVALAAQAAPVPAAVAEPIIANNWIQLSVKPVGNSYLVCPPGFDNDENWFGPYCRTNKQHITVDAYFAELKQQCPGLIPVSADTFLPRSGPIRLVLAYRTPADAKCNLPRSVF